MAAAQHDDADGSKDTHYGGTNGTARRSVTNQDLEILSLKITAKIDALATLFAGIQASQAQSATKLETNSAEIATLRAHMHETGNKIQLINLRTSAVTPELMTELAGMLPVMRKGAEIMTRRSVEDAPTAADLEYLRMARIREEKSDEDGRQLGVAWHVKGYEFPVAIALIILSQIITHYWK